MHSYIDKVDMKEVRVFWNSDGLFTISFYDQDNQPVFSMINMQRELALDIAALLIKKVREYDDANSTHSQ